MILVDSDSGDIHNMAKAKIPRGRSYFPIRIAIPTLAGGVGRQSPAKRTPSEAENIDNFIVSVEHSAEKRRGAKVLERTDNVLLAGILAEVYGTGTVEKDLWYYWYSASAEQRFLIIVNYGADPDATEQMMWVYRVKSDGTFSKDTDPTIPTEQREYLTWGNFYNPIDTDGDGIGDVVKKAAESLRAVAVGSALLILNTQVKAGYNSALYQPPPINGDEQEPAWAYVGYDGITGGDTDNDDYAELRYETTITVDPENIAESWNGFTQYIAGDKAYDRDDAFGTDGGDEDIFGIWKVKESISMIVGPGDKGFEALSPVGQLTSDQANPAFTRDLGATGALSDMEGGTNSLHGGHVDVVDFSGGDENNRATTAIIFFYRAAAIGDIVAYWTEAGVSAGLNQSDTVDGNNVTDWSGAVFNIPYWNGTETVSVPMTLNHNVPMGDLYYYDDTSIHTGWHIGISNALTFLEIGRAIMTAINKLARKEGTSDNSMQTWTDHQISCTAELVGTRVNLTFAYPANQWERVLEEEEDGDPILDDDGNEIPRYTEYTLASDYYYPNPDKQYLGQAVSKLSDLKFPPTESAFNARNAAEGAILSLYPDLGNASGFGKIYYLSQPYLGLSEGHYRVKDIEEQPYLHIIRTPGAMSIIDKKRMPKQLYFDNNQWNIRDVDWDMRTSGSIDTNPGPSIFHDGDGNTVQANITAMSFYRDRLFLSSDDKLVSSRLGDWDNFWLFDPNNITVNDPIDLSVSSNSYTPISYLQPYRNFLFLATTGNTQYELLGSENQISPLTAEISPTSFFGMAENTEPVLMNNNLFFFDKQKMYIYFGEQSDTQQQALELSVNAPYYLPTNFDTPTVSSDRSSIYIIDKDNRNHIYVYTNRVSGDQILQNSFYRFILSENSSIKNIKAYEDYIYIVAEEISDGVRYLTLRQINVNNLELNEPRLDNLVDTVVTSTVYIDDGDYTLIQFPSCSNDIDTIVIKEGDYTGLVVSCTLNSHFYDPEGGFSMALLQTPGDQTGIFSDTPGSLTEVYIGKSYDSTIELSPQYYRDQQAAAVNGTLNLRYGLVRYRNSGGFNFEVSRQGRVSKIVPFEVTTLDDRDILSDVTSYKSHGIFRAPILGFAEDISLKIVSNNIHPLGISSLEFVGKFKFKINSFGG
jgi:hypothetical protein